MDPCLKASPPVAECKPFSKKSFLKNAETIGEGFTILELGGGIAGIKPGLVEIIELSPSGVGVFPFPSTVQCSDEPMAMNDELIVREATLAHLEPSRLRARR
jgi:hypothetical protein